MQLRVGVKFNGKHTGTLEKQMYYANKTITCGEEDFLLMMILLKNAID